MKVRVLLFGPEAAAVSRDIVEIDVPEPTTCGALREELQTRFPALRPHLGTGRFALNSEFAPMDRPIHEGDEVALIGLVSGG